jgi:HAD superfamily hydrolase (TIGR01509 family)
MYKNFFDGYEAIVFDLDGTIINDEFVWDSVLEDVFLPEIISDRPYLGERGQNLRAKIYSIKIRNSFRSDISEDSFYELILNNFFKRLGEIEITPGFIEFAEFLKSKEKKLVLVTNSDQRLTNKILESLSLKKYFDLIITADDVVYPKPAPDIYKLAILKLNLKNEKILVFEDSVSGSNAAEIAGLKMIIVLPEENTPSDYSSKNRIFIENFNVINEDLESDTDTYLEEFFNN